MIQSKQMIILQRVCLLTWLFNRCIMQVSFICIEWLPIYWWLHLQLSKNTFAVTNLSFNAESNQQWMSSKFHMKNESLLTLRLKTHWTKVTLYSNSVLPPISCILGRDHRKLLPSDYPELPIQRFIVVVVWHKVKVKYFFRILAHHFDHICCTDSAQILLFMMEDICYTCCRPQLELTTSFMLNATSLINFGLRWIFQSNL